MSFWNRIKNLAGTARAPLKDGPQTAQHSRLRGEFAGHPSRGMTPARLAQILDSAETGDLIDQNDLAIDMEEKDAHIYAELHKRKMAVSQLAWNVEPPRNASARERRQAAILEESLQGLPFDLADVTFDLMDGVLHGFSCLEFDGWSRVAGVLRPNGAVHRPQSWFTLDRATRSRLLLRAPSESDGELWEHGWIVHIHRSKSGYLSRFGLARVLAWPYLFSNYSVRDLAEFLEIYGIPARVGRFPRDASSTEKQTLLQAVVELGHSAAGIMPEGMAVEFMAAASGQSDPFHIMMSWCDRAKSKAILGGTLSTEPGDVGSQSLGRVHNDVRKEIRDHDAGQCAGTMTRYLLWPMARLNGMVGDPSRLPRFVYDTGEPEDMALYADALPKLVGVGMKIPHSWARDKLRIPEPEKDEPVLSVSNTPPDQRSPPFGGEQSPQTEAIKRQAAASIAVASAGIDDDDPSPVMDHTKLLETDAAESIRLILAVIERMIAETEDIESLPDRLLEMYGALDTDELTKIMTLAFACADLAGRVDVSDGR